MRKKISPLIVLISLLTILTACKIEEKRVIENTDGSSIILKESEEDSTVSTTSSDLSYIENSPLQSYLDSFKDQKIGIYIKEIDSDKRFCVNEQTIFYGASIAKLPIIFYTQEQLKKEAFQKSTMFIYTDDVNDIPGAMIQGGTGVMQNEIAQKQLFELGQLFEWTIVNSDNMASNMLSYYVANQNGPAFLETIAPFYSFKQDEFTKNMTAATAAELMLAIYKNQIGIDYFLETEWKDEKIGVLETPTYHKIGTNEGFNHDVGIVVSNKPYVISILSEDFLNDDIEKMVKEIDRLIKEE